MVAAVGIFNGFQLMVTNSTFSGNSASGSGGGIFNDEGIFHPPFKNSIIANSPSGGNCGGTTPITPVGVNFSTDNTCGAGFTVVPSTGAGGLNLGPLQDNGGPTFTHALLPGSVAIDKVTDCTDLSAMPATVTTDQRGFLDLRMATATALLSVMPELLNCSRARWSHVLRTSRSRMTSISVEQLSFIPPRRQAAIVSLPARPPQARSSP